MTRLLSLLATGLLLVGCASGPLLVEAEPPVIVAPDLTAAFAEPWKIPHGEWKPVDGVLRMTEIPARKHVPVLQHWVGLKTAVIELDFRQNAPGGFLVGCDGAKHVARVVVTPTALSIAEDSVAPSHTIATTKVTAPANSPRSCSSCRA